MASPRRQQQLRSGQQLCNRANFRDSHGRHLDGRQGYAHSLRGRKSGYAPRPSSSSQEAPVAALLTPPTFGPPPPPPRPSDEGSGAIIRIEIVAFYTEANPNWPCLQPATSKRPFIVPFYPNGRFNSASECRGRFDSQWRFTMTLNNMVTKGWVRTRGHIDIKEKDLISCHLEEDRQYRNTGKEMVINVDGRWDWANNALQISGIKEYANKAHILKQMGAEMVKNRWTKIRGEVSVKGPRITSWRIWET